MGTPVPDEKAATTGQALHLSCVLSEFSPILEKLLGFLRLEANWHQR